MAETQDKQTIQKSNTTRTINNNSWTVIFLAKNLQTSQIIQLTTEFILQFQFDNSIEFYVPELNFKYRDERLCINKFFEK